LLLLRTDYVPIPENALGHIIPDWKDILFEDLGESLYVLSNGTYNTIFIMIDNEIIAVDMPSTIGKNYLKAISEVTYKSGTYFYIIILIKTMLTLPICFQIM